MQVNHLATNQELGMVRMIDVTGVRVLDPQIDVVSHITLCFGEQAGKHVPVPQ